MIAGALSSNPKRNIHNKMHKIVIFNPVSKVGRQ